MSIVEPIVLTMVIVARVAEVSGSCLAWGVFAAMMVSGLTQSAAGSAVGTARFRAPADHGCVRGVHHCLHAAVALLFVQATTIILVAAEPLVEGLIDAGRHLRVTVSLFSLVLIARRTLDWRGVAGAFRRPSVLPQNGTSSVVHLRLSGPSWCAHHQGLAKGQVPLQGRGLIPLRPRSLLLAPISPLGP